MVTINLNILHIQTDKQNSLSVDHESLLEKKKMCVKNSQQM